MLPIACKKFLGSETALTVDTCLRMSASKTKGVIDDRYDGIQPFTCHRVHKVDWGRTGGEGSGHQSWLIIRGQCTIAKFLDLSIIVIDYSSLECVVRAIQSRVRSKKHLFLCEDNY